MSDQSNNVALSLQQILLSIADGLTEAQSALQNVQPYDQYGRPNITYQLPYLDFKLQVESTVEVQEQSGGSQSGWLKEHVLFRPVKLSSATESKSEIISTISGRFVANIPNEGLPQVFLAVTSKKSSLTATHQEFEIEALLSNSAGEKLKDSLIEINFDEDSSLQFNGGLNVTTPSMDKAEAKTDIEGKVLFTLSIPVVDYNNGKIFVFVANSGPITQEFSISKDN